MHRRPDFAGEQDDDPLNDTDCATASDRGTIVHAAEAAGLLRHRARRDRHRTGRAPGPPGTGHGHWERHATGTGRARHRHRHGGTAGTPGRVGTSVRLRIRRAVQTSADAAPALLKARLRLDGARADRLGHWVVRIDGRR